jgi:DNA-binding beta-propeller fold protein YncE
MNAGSHCYGLFVDIDNNLYCSMGDQNQVIKRSLYSNMNTTTIVAGNGSNGSASNQLSGPRGIFVDINLDLYVADFFNHRIQLFRSGQSNGTTIVGKGSSGSYALNQPHWVVLDGDGYLFIVDYGNHRIVAQGPTGFRCLVGCSGERGSTASQLNFPLTMAFDSHGNIYVTDRDNDRIQKFILTINSCGKCH